MSDLRSQDNGQLSTKLRLDPLRHMRALEAACHEIASENRPGYDKNGKIATTRHTSFWSDGLQCRF